MRRRIISSSTNNIIRNNLNHSTLNNTTTFSFVQYNILANCYAHKNWFKECNNEHLKWNFRKPILLQEIQDLNGSIITIQEIDDYNFFHNSLYSIGYNSCFEQRPNKLDGCAIFWKRDKFDFINSKFINFNDSTNRISLLIMLIEKTLNIPLVIITTHLFWRSDYYTLQLEEIDKILNSLPLFIEESNKLIISSSKIANPNPSVIFSGDFNSLVGGYVYNEMLNRNWISSYAECDEEPLFTYYPRSEEDIKRNNNYRNTIDFIFHNNINIKAIECLNVSNITDIFWNGYPPPNPIYASDHSSLKVQFEFGHQVLSTCNNND